MKTIVEQVSRESGLNAVAAKGLIINVSDGNWATDPGARWVDVMITASSAPIPRFYSGVAWNCSPGCGFDLFTNLKKPEVGGYVVIHFVGDNTNFPYVSSILQHDNQHIDLLTTAHQARLSVPSKSIQASNSSDPQDIFNSGGSILPTQQPTGPSDFLSSLTKLF